MTTINIFDTWQQLMSLCNVQQGGQIRPQTDFQNWYNTVNTELFHAKCAKFQLTQQGTDELSPFLKSVIVPVTIVPGRNYGVIVLPTDYEYLANLKVLRQLPEDNSEVLQKYPIIDGNGKSTQYTDPDYAGMFQQYATLSLVENTVNIVDDQNWGDCLTHRSKGPTFDNPKAVQDSSGLKIAPKGIQAVVLDYFRTPRNAVFGYTVGTGDIVQYDPNTSVQLEWTNVIQNEFLSELMKKYAAYVGDMSLYQQADNNKKQLV